MAHLKKAVIMAGGTGGHVFPGLALADLMIEHGIEVRWLGTPTGIEARLVPEKGIELMSVDVQGLRGNGFMRLLKAPWILLKALWVVLFQLARFKPDVVVGMGGFVSGPGGVAAWLSRIPLVIHEQNAIPGLTNKLLARLSTRVCEAFPHSFEARFRAVITGNPVRAAIEQLPGPDERQVGQHRPLRLLVLGGSLGASALNETVPQALSRLPREQRPVVKHQTGARWLEQTQEYYRQLDIEADVLPFIDDMAGVLGWADAIICRAGALTVSELCVAGVGAILVPFPYAVDDHQTKNASYMVKGDAALCVQQSDLTIEWLADRLAQWVHNPAALREMAVAARKLAQVNSAQKVMDQVREAAQKSLLTSGV